MRSIKQIIVQIANWLFKYNISNNLKVIQLAFGHNFLSLKCTLIQKIPYLAQLENKDWTKIHDNYKERLAIIEDSKTECFIDIAIKSCCQDIRIAEEHLKRLEALNDLIDFLLSHPISKKYPKKVRDKIMGLFDIVKNPKKNDSPFKNSLHELLFLRHLLDSDYKDIILEEKLPNHRDVDFVKIYPNGERIGFELETTQRFDASKVHSTEDIWKFFNNAAIKKAKEKFCNCDEINYDKFFIVLFVEIKDNMGKLIFPETYGAGVMVLSPQFYYSDKGHYQISFPNEQIADLKRDDPSFFKN